MAMATAGEIAGGAAVVLVAIAASLLPSHYRRDAP
jgi:hypothetical protein